MATHLTPQYRVAEARLREARSGDDRRAALEQMLAALPRHVANARLRLDLRRQLERARQEMERRGARRAHSVHVEPEGAAQVVILGPPNAGKSSLLGALTRAEPAIADYPFTTTRPQSGLMLFEDVQVQLVDLPAVTAQHLEPWLGAVARAADAALLVVDPSSAASPGDLEEVLDQLARAHSPLVGEVADAADGDDLPLPTLLVVARADAAGEADAQVLEELYGDRFPSVRVSVHARTGLQALKVRLWQLLGLVRVHHRVAGRRQERPEAFVLPAGATVLDLAARVDRELPDRVVSARVWGGKLDGQRVARDFELRDRDLVEIGT